MAITKLALYNKALTLLGERRLVSVYADDEKRKVLDEVYGLDAARNCMEMAKPKFSLRTVALSDPTASSTGLDQIYTLPSDYVTTAAPADTFFADADLENPIRRFTIEGRTVVTDVETTIYARYISASRSLSEWTPSFASLVAAYLARETASRINPTMVAAMETVFDRRLSDVVSLEGIKEGGDLLLPQKISGSLDAGTLDLYNATLALLGKPELRYGGDESLERLALDTALTLGGDYCLDVVRPKFASRVVNLGGGSTSAEHGFDNVFSLPAGYLAILDIFSDEALTEKVERYFIEDTKVAVEGHASPYLRYTSNASDIADWSPSFTRVVAAYLARELAPRFAPEKAQELDGLLEQRVALSVAIEGDKEPAQRPRPALLTLSAFQMPIFNMALQLLGQPVIVSDNDESAARVALEYAWGEGGEAVDTMLEIIRPRFASTVVELDSSSAGIEHGYTNVFDLPADYITFLSLYQDNLLDEPVNRYFIDTDTLATNQSTVYLRYIASGPTEADYTIGFKRALAAYLALEAAPQILKYSEPLDRDRDIKRVRAAFENRVQFATETEGYKEPPRRARPSTNTLTNAWRTVYNTALEILDLEPIISNDDDSDRRAALDFAYNNSAVQSVLSIISWGFARKSVKLTYDSGAEPAFGYDYAFAVPDDFVRIDAFSGDEYFRHPAPYTHEGGRFFSVVQNVYVRYVSNEEAATPSTWPQYFSNLVAAELARRCGRLPGANMQKALAVYDEYRKEAFSTDAQMNPPRRIAEGSWNRARDSWPRRRSNYLGRP